jgi:vitamin B12 transporter
MSITVRCRVAAVALSIVCTSAIADSGDSGDISLDNVIVTATRSREKIEDVIGSVTVITREEIEARQPQTLEELLRAEAGIDFTNNGGPGNLTSIFMRGGNPGQVLVLIDGVRVGSITQGATSYEFIPVNQLERVEIVRGPRSSLWGSEAIGGVIQFFTRKPDGVTASVGTGTEHTYDANAGFGARVDDTWFSILGDRYQTAGFNTCRSPQACFTTEPDRDGFRNTSGSVRLGHAWGEVADIELGTLYAQGLTHYDGTFSNQSAFREIVPTARAHVRPVNNWDLSLTLGDTHDDQDSRLDGVFVDRFNSERRSATLQSDWRPLAAQLITVGVDYIKDLVDSTTPFDRSSRDNTGVFAVYQGHFGAHELEASVRRDDNQQFGTHTTGNAGWKWFLSKSLNVVASWGSSFRAPTFNDLYYPGFSNPNLDPERATNVEMGIGGNIDKQHWSVNAFETRISDLIDLDQNFVPGNVSKARIRGAEGQYSLKLDAWDVRASYTWLDPRNRSEGANRDNILQRRARNSARAQTMYLIGPVSVGTIVTAQGARYNNTANTDRLGGYVLVDLLGEYAVTPQWRVQAKLTNAFDHTYETVHYYNQQGRAFFVSVRYDQKPARE